jgi:Flp pilus assembly protein TadG
VLPVFVLLIGGMIDVSWQFYAESGLDSATSIGCRAGAIIDPGVAESNMVEVQSTTHDALVLAMSQQPLSDCEEGCTVEVSVVGQTRSRTLVYAVGYDFEPILGMALAPMTLSATQVVRMEWQRR